MKKITPIVIASGNGAPGLASGIAVLRRGGTALDAVEACARVIEADPTDTSVGRGGKPNVLGVVELDASLVDGTTHRVGAVGAVRGRDRRAEGDAAHAVDAQDVGRAA